MNPRLWVLPKILTGDPPQVGNDLASYCRPMSLDRAVHMGTASLLIQALRVV